MINDLIGKEIEGKYRIESLIRETELGDFYHGLKVSTGEPVTVKVLAPAMAIDQRYVDRFLANAGAEAGVASPYVLNSHFVGTDASGVPYAVYEGTEGETLREALRRDGPFTAPRAVGIAKQIASGLAAAHNAGTIHGGLNPEKIYLYGDSEGESVKIYDFGARKHSRNSMIAAGYLAPEQCGSLPAADERTDVYSLGVVLFEMLAGERPFAGSTPAEMIAKLGSEPPPPLSAFRDDLHPQLEPIILSAIAHDPDRRYQSMGDLEEDLGRIADEIGSRIPAQNNVAAAAAGGRRNIWQTAFVVLAGVAVLAAALIYGTSVRQTNPTASLVPDANSLPVQPINPATGAQEDALSKLGDLGDASLVPNGTMDIPPGTLPGGDGFNAWANGGVPPAGAPLPGTQLQNPAMTGPQPPQYIPPGGQTVTIDPNGGSVFMPTEGGVILVPIPANTEPAAKPTPTPKAPAANTAVKPTGTPIPKSTSGNDPAAVKPEVKTPAVTAPPTNGKGKSKKNGELD